MHTFYKGVRAYSANYANADNNFVIQNLKTNNEQRDIYYPSVCVLKNIIMRGLPTQFSCYLSEKLGSNGDLIKIENKILLVSEEGQYWNTTIKGYDETNRFPAKILFDKYLPEKFGEKYAFLKQLIMPEAYINDIVGIYNAEYLNQQVDFYIPTVKLIIEVDGAQHSGKLDTLKDKERDLYLREHGIEVIRIPASAIDNNTKALQNKLSAIENHFDKHHEVLDGYVQQKVNYQNETAQRVLNAVAVMRFQVTILELILSGRLKMGEKVWNIQVRENEISGIEEIAINDLLIWMENLLGLRNINLEIPRVNLTVIGKEDEFDCTLRESVKIDFSILKTWTDEHLKNRDIIFVRNAYFQDENYFTVSTDDPIHYPINDSERKDFGEKTSFETPKELLFLLKNLFGFDAFNSGQARIIAHALSLRNTIGLLPTGSGKSLCYQMAALLQPCISFCVCPIKALMYDQVDNLNERHINRTNFITSDLSPEEKQRIQYEFSRGKYHWVFVSPERFQDAKFREYLDQLNRERNLHIGMAVIDEVHCLSEWGHSFRTSYLNLVKTIMKYSPTATILGLTATASVNTLKNIMVEFEMTDRSDVITTGKYTRDELSFEIEICNSGEAPRALLYQRLSTYRRHFPDIFKGNNKKARCGIIFTPYKNGKNGCYELSADLSKYLEADVKWYSGEKPKKIKHYSDELFTGIKNKTQKGFKKNEFTLLVATKAFGMGIDKPNIRYTIHYGIPSSLEALYQEAGRAGRDREKAQCTVIYEPELYDNIEWLREMFAVETDVNRLKEIQNTVCPPYDNNNGAYNEWTGKDIFKQFMLLTSGLNSYDEDMELARVIYENFAVPGEKGVVIQVNNIRRYKPEHSFTYANLEKTIYHLSIIGIIDDWTVSGYRDNSAKIIVDFCDYSEESISEKLVSYIRNYDALFSLDKNCRRNEYKQYIQEWGGEDSAAVRAFSIYWKWYYNNVIYSRREALKHIMEQCDKFKKEDADKFKRNIEAFFSFNDVTAAFEKISDDQKNFVNWFEVLNIQVIKENGIENMIMSLSRFLESYKNNIGLNFISGFLRLANGDFEDGDGRERLVSALHDISTFSEDEKYELIGKILPLADDLLDEEQKEIFSETVINNIEYDHSSTMLYKGMQDNYSIQYILDSALSSIVKSGRDLEIW
ncbi:RecQ family ATP-dependent DNA helicase [Anaerobium acetethylicum]|uniref:DNA 3'-5' helicase n=1 Tax=Anaerobium acetethylicum TaxID=1619234 RepID=A0A1D3TXP9_9FIRM|nr:RecQ family ATP-dependent DNA helicase [Anaerobium acetethylicum]SCP99126.1 ATP-dependent DNA helicase RecQ [Anaerobium acetethylicum]